MTDISQKFAIENYRSFKKKFYLTTKPITLITGPNGSGKSTYTDAVKLFERHFNNGMIPRNIPLSDLTNNKRISQIENWNTDSKAVKIYIKKRINAKKLSNDQKENYKVITRYDEQFVLGELVLSYKPDKSRTSYNQEFENNSYNKKQYTLVDIGFYFDNHPKKNLINFDSSRGQRDFASDQFPGIGFDLNHLNKLSKIKIDKKVLANMNKYWYAFGPSEDNDVFFPVIGKILSLKNGSDTFIYDFIRHIKFSIGARGHSRFTNDDWKKFYSKSSKTKYSLGLHHSRHNEEAELTEFNTEKIFNNSLININDYPNINFFETFNDEYKVNWINDILLFLGIGEQIFFKELKHDFVEITIEKNDKTLFLNEFSKGLQRLIKLIIFLPLTWFEDNYSDISKVPWITIIEEPELSLHPKLQSKIADVLSKIPKAGDHTRENYYDDSYESSYIIETHSEYLIRKLQYLCAKKEIYTKNIIIYYFPEGEDEEPYEIKIDENGNLSREFGPGFFDEADNIAIELFKINKNTLN